MSTLPFNPIRGLDDNHDTPELDEGRLTLGDRFVEIYDPLLGLGLMDSDQVCMLCVDTNEIPLDSDGAWVAKEDVLRGKIEALAQEPRVDRLTRLVLCDWGGCGLEEGTFYDSELLFTLCHHAHRFSELTNLYIGDDPAHTTPDDPESIVGFVAPVFRAFPGLRELHLRSRYLDLGRSVTHPNLKRITIETLENSQELLDSLIQGNLPALESLDIWLPELGGWSDYSLRFEGEGLDDELIEEDMDALQPLLSGKALPSLRHLGLTRTPITDPFAQELVMSPLYGQLRSLDLSGGYMGLAGALALAKTAPWSKLEALDISSNVIPHEGLYALSKGPWQLRDTGQRV